jgi:hypothetical protein
VENSNDMIYTYDAFISYRHGEKDSLVAERLHKELESYMVPAELQKIGHPKKLTRIFRDKEELPTSPSLDGNIKDALKSSRYLIVICSERTRESQWVSAEIEYFQQLGRYDRICSILIDGEPGESFPDAAEKKENGSAGRPYNHRGRFR